MARGNGVLTWRSVGDPDHVACGRALVCLDDLELHPLTLGQGPETLRDDRAVMHKAILITFLGRDESKALCIVEPLDSSVNSHTTAPSCSLSLRRVPCPPCSNGFG
jgi:hypothetical protein